MPTLDEINGVAVRTPVRMNLDAYAQALNKIDQRDLAAREEMSRLNAGLANIKAQLNVADYDWFDTKVEEINNIINKEASFGNYANALNKAIELSGTYLQDSGLLARIKANQDYEIKKKEVQALADTGKLSPITADRWLAENEYRFDEETNSLATYKSPIHGVNLDNAFNYVNAMTLARTNQRPLYEYLDVNGNTTKEFESAITKYHVEKTTLRTTDQLYSNFDTYLRNHQEIYDYLEQERADNEWQISKLEEQYENVTSEAERNLLEKQINARKRLTRDPNNLDNELDVVQYLKSRSDSFIQNLAINDVIASEKVQHYTKSEDQVKSEGQKIVDETKPKYGVTVPGTTAQPKYVGFKGGKESFKSGIKSFVDKMKGNQQGYTQQYQNYNNVPFLSN